MTIFRALLLVAFPVAGMASVAPATAQDADRMHRRYIDARYELEVKDDAAVLAQLDAGLPATYQDPADGYTLLHHAASNGREAMVRELLRRGADPRAKSHYGFTPVDSGSTRPAIVAMLVAAGGARPAGAHAPAPAAPARPAARPATASTPQSPRARDCQQKWYADQALCSDTSCKMRTYRKWQQCLKTGRYW